MKRLLLIVFLFIILAPQQLGGQNVYLIIAGNSMEPGFHRGDMAVVRASAGYAIGDVAAYMHPTIGPVIHRIIDSTEQGYVFKGDNNAWIDSYQPSDDELMGKSVYRIPRVGRLISLLRNPTNLLLYSIFSSLLLFASVRAQPRTGLAKHRPGAPKRKPRRIAAMSLKFPVRLQDAFIGLLTLALFALFLCILAFSQPVLVVEPIAIPYQHRGLFDYTAELPEDLFDAGALQAGDTIYRQITDRVDLSFKYELESEGIENVAGSYQIFAVLSESTGWRRTILLDEGGTFEGKTASITVGFRISRFQAIVDQLAEQTGIDPSRYMVSLSPRIQLTGNYADREWSDEFNPSLEFQVNPLVMGLIREGEEDAASIAPTQSGNLPDAVVSENRVGLFGISLSVASARMYALALASLLGLVCLALGLRITWLNRQHETKRIEGLYGGLLIPVTGLDMVADMREVAVTEFEHLLRISREEGRLILKLEDERTVKYLVRGDKQDYFYLVAN